MRCSIASTIHCTRGRVTLSRPHKFLTAAKSAHRAYTTDMASENAVPITASPNAGQVVAHQGETYRTIREGQAYILVPPKARTELDPRAAADASESQKVFYNPIQQFNRDLSVLAIRAFGRDVCERRRAKHEVSKAKQNGKKKDKQAKKDYDAAKASKGKTTAESGVAGKEDTAASGDKGTSKRTREDDDGESGPTKLRKGADGEKVPAEAGAEPEDSVVEGMDVDSGSATAPASKVTVAANGDQAQSTETNAPPTTPATPYQPKFRILDALSATGLRALRYAQEIPFATSITANDMSPDAVRSIALNVRHNQLESKITSHTSNALAHMYSVAFPPETSHGPEHVNQRYDVIDLDPYGTAAPFIDAALHALNDGGMLCVTCTDSGVFASCGYSEKTFSLYGGMPIKGPHSHEGGLRLILHSIATSAARYGLAIEPLLSLSIDFYIRVFVRVRKSPADVKFLASKTMLAYDCDAGCGSWTTQPLGRVQKVQGKGPNINWKHSIAQAPSSDRFCEHCGNKTHVAGPMWGGPIHNASFIEKMLADVQNADKEVYATHERVEGMLDTALDEIFVSNYVAEKGPQHPDFILKTAPEQVDQQPFFVIPSSLAKVLHCQAPSEAAIKGALRHAGYRATRSHCKPGSVKTEAPFSAIWEIMREWVRQKAPVKEGSVKEGMPGWKIMLAARAPEQNGSNSADESPIGDAETPEIVTEHAPRTNGEAVEPVKAQDVKKMKVVFDEALGRDKPRGKKLVRYQVNPRENWGPMAKAR